MRVPLLETERLTIRPFTHHDLDAVYQILDVEIGGGDGTREARRDWLRWTVLNYEALANLHQPPYGDRAVVLRRPGRLIGACGFVPCLAPFAQFALERSAAVPSLNTTEFGLYWAISPAHRRQGYAAEAARALIDFAFGPLRLQRIVAATEYDNLASLAVMRKLGMRIENNPLPEPPWLQAVGFLQNDARREAEDTRWNSW